MVGRRELVGRCDGRRIRRFGGAGRLVMTEPVTGIGR